MEKKTKKKLFPQITEIPFLDLFPKRGTFNYKILQRMHHDRNELFTLFADKLLVRDYVTKHSPSVKLIPLYHSTDTPDDIPFNTLPSKYVVKANHGSGWVLVMDNEIDIRTKRALTPSKIKRICNKWLKKKYGKVPFFKQKHYWNIKPNILIEKFLEDKEGNVPKDYKFFVFHGQTKFIQVDADRFGDHSRNLYTASWEKLDAQFGYKDSPILDPKPELLSKMLQISSELAVDSDFLRIDLYTLENEVYFGEITCTPGGGVEKIIPKKYDKEFGSYW